MNDVLLVKILKAVATVIENETGLANVPSMEKAPEEKLEPVVLTAKKTRTKKVEAPAPIPTRETAPAPVMAAPASAVIPVGGLFAAPAVSVASATIPDLEDQPSLFAPPVAIAAAPAPAPLQITLNDVLTKVTQFRAKFGQPAVDDLNKQLKEKGVVVSMATPEILKQVFDHLVKTLGA